MQILCRYCHCQVMLLQLFICVAKTLLHLSEKKNLPAWYCYYLLIRTLQCTSVQRNLVALLLFFLIVCVFVLIKTWFRQNAAKIQSCVSLSFFPWVIMNKLLCFCFFPSRRKLKINGPLQRCTWKPFQRSPSPTLLLVQNLWQQG